MLICYDERHVGIIHRDRTGWDPWVMQPPRPSRYATTTTPLSGGPWHPHWGVSGGHNYVAFMGETLDIGVADLLSVLARRRQTGRLAINADGDEVFLYLKYGNLVGVTSSNHSLRLGRILMKMSLLDAVRLEAAMRVQETTTPPQPLGEILVKSG